MTSRKPSPSSKRTVTRRALLGAGLGSAAALMLAADVPARRLVVSSVRPEKRTFYHAPISDGDKITLRWIHSVDHNPWVEHYFVQGCELRLDCIELRTMGAGTPSSAPRVYKSGHTLHMCGYDRPYESLNWIHSHDVAHTVTIRRRQGTRWSSEVIETEDLPHRASITLRVL